MDDDSVTCPRCGSPVPETASECRGCGMPAGSGGLARNGRRLSHDPAIEPEVLDSLEEAERTRFSADPQTRHIGCTLGPGCGCVGLPLAVLAGVVVSSLVALLWVLSLGRVPASLLKLARQARRGFHRS